MRQNTAMEQNIFVKMHKMYRSRHSRYLIFGLFLALAILCVNFSLNVVCFGFFDEVFTVTATKIERVSCKGLPCPPKKQVYAMPNSSDSEAKQRDGCDLCNDSNFLFIFGTGRSGTTTILNMLNTVPNINLAGENYGELKAFHALYENAKNYLGFQDRRDKVVFHGEMDSHELLCTIQSWIRTTIGKPSNPSNTNIIGFKEIRHKPNQKAQRLAPDESQKYEKANTSTDYFYDFLLKAFPCSRIVINYRQNTTQQHLSRIHHGWTKSPGSLQEESESMIAWHLKNKERSFLLPLEEFSTDNFNHLLGFLGIENCTFTKVCHSNSHRKRGFNNDSRNAHLQGKCNFLGWSKAIGQGSPSASKTAP